MDANTDDNEVYSSLFELVAQTHHILDHDGVEAHSSVTNMVGVHDDGVSPARAMLPYESVHIPDVQISTRDCPDASCESNVEEAVSGADGNDSLSLSSFGTELNASGRRHHLPDMPPTHPDRTHHQREREVSTMGSTSSIGRSRSGLRLAKKERRQKAKDGHEGAEAFAGNDLGTSCEDEGMTEIVMTSTNHRCGADSSNNDWASPLLLLTDTTNPSTTKRTTVRRGKSELMRSWLDTPEAGTNKHMFMGAVYVAHPHKSPLKKHLGVFSGYQSQPQSEEDEGGVGHSVVLPSCVERHESLTSEQLLPTTSLSSIDSNIGSLTSIVSSTVGSGSSVNHSRPRDNIRSIRAHRGTTSILTGSSTFISTLPLPLKQPQHSPTLAGEEHPGPLSNQVEGSTQHLSLDASHEPFTLPTMAVDLGGGGEFVKEISDGGPPSPLKLAPITHSSPHLSFHYPHHHATPIQSTSTISLHPGPKPRNVVTFNADAYNLDAWDADVMGLFALPTEGCSRAVKKDTPTTKFSDMAVEISAISVPDESTSSPLFGISSAVNSWGDERGVSCSAQNSTNIQTSSVSVLASYFDRKARSSLSAEAHQGPLAFTDCDSYLSFECENQSHEGGCYVIDQVSGGGGGSPQSPYSGLTRESARFTSNPHRQRDCVGHLQHIREHHTMVNNASILSTPTPPTISATTDSSKRVSSRLLKWPHPERSGFSLSSIDRGMLRKGTSFSQIVGSYVAVNTLVHSAAFYTEQLANPTSGTGLDNFRRQHDRWQLAPEVSL